MTAVRQIALGTLLLALAFLGGAGAAAWLSPPSGVFETMGAGAAQAAGGARDRLDLRLGPPTGEAGRR